MLDIRCVVSDLAMHMHDREVLETCFKRGHTWGGGGGGGGGSWALFFQVAGTGGHFIA